MYFHGIAWFGIFVIVFSFYFLYFKEKISLIRNRVKNSLTWPLHVKIINGCCWALPFAMIIVLPQYFQYLILLGIGLGNFSTYIFMKLFSQQNNKEQMIVGLTALLVIPLAVKIDTAFVAQQDFAILLSRVLISISYALGGAYALFSKTK